MRIVLPLKVACDLLRSRELLDELGDNYNLRGAYLRKIENLLSLYGLSMEYFDQICEAIRKGKIV